MNKIWEIFDFAWGDPANNDGAAVDDPYAETDHDDPSAVTFLAIEDGDPDGDESCTSTMPEQTEDHVEDHVEDSLTDGCDVPSQAYFDTYVAETQPEPPSPEYQIEPRSDDESPEFVPGAKPEDEPPAVEPPAPAPPAELPRPLASGASSSMPPPPPVDPEMVAHKRRVMARLAEIRLWFLQRFLIQQS